MTPCERRGRTWPADDRYARGETGHDHGARPADVRPWREHCLNVEGRRATRPYLGHADGVGLCCARGGSSDKPRRIRSVWGSAESSERSRTIVATLCELGHDAVADGSRHPPTPVCAVLFNECSTSAIDASSPSRTREPLCRQARPSSVQATPRPSDMLTSVSCGTPHRLRGR